MSERQRVFIWDLPTRLFHWGLVLALGLSWYSAEQGLSGWDLHKWSGYAVLTLVLFRILWGFVGSETARFRDFLAGPRTVGRYLVGWWRDRTPSRGHNPLGGWAVIVLLALVLAQAVTGLFATDDILRSGPLTGWVGSDLERTMTRLHTQIFDVLLILVTFHVAAIAVYRWVRGERLLVAMISGYKRNGFAPPWIAPLYRAVVAGTVAAGVVWLLLVTAP
ncbi:cytochrome b/b6 domain-containing protein [Halorhodospira halophila]|uniref:Cytochrome B561 n=1 Tax=Halorhodospira halophila (strain DSM 244 / SL1) TaxID=349124 RepID=A1WWM9_HALHL|nr:cytochrome b/b6 domain-containing protein [Halorhodospira halophila]ABM62091.1 cytochrome B561 [Halorhodospira halophila SL1]MBK1729419.1 hydrogenase [Halorhodospira halophila]